ncbi:MAG: iron ABC transporter permease [Pseudomonadota bacterium]
MQSSRATFGGTGRSALWGWFFAAGGLAILTGLPIIAVLLSLVSGGGEGFDHLLSTILPTYALNSIVLMVMVGILTSLIGVSTAWVVSTCAFAGRRFWSWALVLPIAAPAYIIAYFYTDLLDVSGPVQTALRGVFGAEPGAAMLWSVRSMPGAALMLSLVLYPYVYLLARASFAVQSRSEFLAARSLGASPVQAFFRVAVPGARPAIAGGLALVLMETLADFGVADYFAIPTFSTGIFRTWFALGDRLAAMQLAGSMLLVVLVLVAIEAASRRGRVASDDRIISGEPLFKLTGTSRVFAHVLCGLPVFAGFMIPAIGLAWMAFTVGDGQRAEVVGGYALNSVIAATSTAVVASFLAVILVYAQRASRRLASRTTQVGLRSSVRFTTLGYALPGTLLAVGLLGPLGGFDIALTRWARDTLGYGGGLILSGSIIVLVYALVVRFLTVSFNAVSSGMAKIPPVLDEAAATLGATGRATLTRVHFPLLSGQLAVSGSLVFVDVMRELPATLILRPFNFETLATRVYRLASDERLAEASTASLLIVALGLLPVVLLNRPANHAAAPSRD